MYRPSAHNNLVMYVCLLKMQTQLSRLNSSYSLKKKVITMILSSYFLYLRKSYCTLRPKRGYDTDVRTYYSSRSAITENKYFKNRDFFGLTKLKYRCNLSKMDPLQSTHNRGKTSLLRPRVLPNPLPSEFIDSSRCSRHQHLR